MAVHNGRRRAPAHYRGTSRRKPYARPSGPGRPANARSELDLALAAAAELPQPPAATFREFGIDERLVRALAAQDITAPFSIQARALP
jgi:hypothetical protein